jgi:hypothetical protein
LRVHVSAGALTTNLTRKLFSAGPVQIAMLKGLVAGAADGGLAATQALPFLNLARYWWWGLWDFSAMA